MYAMTVKCYMVFRFFLIYICLTTDRFDEVLNYSMLSLVFIAISFRVTEENWFSKQICSGPRSFFLMFSMLLKAWSHRRTDMYRKDNGLKYAEFGYPVTKFISSAARSSRDRYVEPRS